MDVASESILTVPRKEEECHESDRENEDGNDSDKEISSPRKRRFFYHSKSPYALHGRRDYNHRRARFDKSYFDRKVWRKRSAKTLIDATLAVDALVYRLVEAQSLFGYWCPEELRELSLSLAVIERNLTLYAEGVRKHNLSANENANHLWVHPGGIVSWLQILTLQLHGTTSEIDNLFQLNSFLNFVTSNSLMKGLTIFGLAVMYGVPFKGTIRRGVDLAIYYFESFLNNITQHKAFKNAISTAMQLSGLSFILPNLGKRFLSFLKEIGNSLGTPADRRRLITILTFWFLRFRYILVPFLAYFIYTFYRAYRLQRLRQQNRHLRKLIIYWDLCFGAARDRNGEESSQLISSIKKKKKQSSQTMFLWMLKQVPPNATSHACFWYGLDPQMKRLHRCVEILHATSHWYFSYFGSNWLFLPTTVIAIGYYVIFPYRASMRFNQVIAHPDYQLLRTNVQLLDSPFSRWFSLHILPLFGFYPKVCHQEVHFYPRKEDVLAFKKSILRQNRRFSRTRTLSTEFNINQSSVMAALMADAEKSSIQPIPLKILSHSNVEIFASDPKITTRVHSQRNSVVIFLHGGAFLASFVAGDIPFLSKWAHTQDALFVSIQYSLAPENKYPTALCECYLAYRYIVSGGLGFHCSRVAIVADSNGCSLAVGMLLKLIQDDQRIPDGLVLISPCIDLTGTTTASRLMFMTDPIVPLNLYHQVQSLYIPSTIADEDSMFICPLRHTPREYFAKFPPTFLTAGSYDPFLDDAIDLAHKLKDASVPVRLKVFQALPHAFLSFGVLLRDSGVARAEACVSSWIEEIITSPHI